MLAFFCLDYRLNEFCVSKMGGCQLQPECHVIFIVLKLTEVLDS